MLRFPKIEIWEQWFVRCVVIVAAVTAVLHAAFKSFPDWAVTSVLFLAAFTIMVQNEQLSSLIRSTVKRFRDSFTESDDKLNHILQQLTDNADVSRAIERALADRTHVYIYANHAKFYNGLRASTKRARGMIRASYMRRFPPAALGGEAETFFDASVDWARQSENHRLRRVVCRPEGELLEWVNLQNRKSQEVDSHYRIRIVDWRVREVDALSVSIIDEELVFFAFSGSEDSMRGFSIQNPEVARYFIEYHDQLWGSSMTLEEFLASQEGPDAED